MAKAVSDSGDSARAAPVRSTASSVAGASPRKARFADAGVGRGSSLSVGGQRFARQKTPKALARVRPARARQLYFGTLMGSTRGWGKQARGPKQGDRRTDLRTRRPELGFWGGQSGAGSSPAVCVYNCELSQAESEVCEADPLG